MLFSPTYLYIKQHTITGKLYFGKCSRPLNKMLKYRGSGTLWKKHLKIHGIENVITLWYGLYDNVFDLVSDALSMSNSFDIVNNKSWLNLKVEIGIDGNMGGEYSSWFGRRHTNETKLKMSEWQSDGKCPNIGRKTSEEVVRHFSKTRTGELNGMFGKTHDMLTREKIGKKSEGRIPNEQTRLKMSDARLNPPLYQFYNITTDEYYFGRKRDVELYIKQPIRYLLKNAYSISKNGWKFIKQIAYPNNNFIFD